MRRHHFHLFFSFSFSNKKQEKQHSECSFLFLVLLRSCRSHQWIYRIWLKVISTWQTNALLTITKSVMIMIKKNNRMVSVVQLVALLLSLNLVDDVSAFSPQLTQSLLSRTILSHPSSSKLLPRKPLFSSSSSSSPDPSPTGGVDGFGINGINGINGASTPSSSSSSSSSSSTDLAATPSAPRTVNNSDSEEMTSYFEMPGTASSSEASVVLNSPLHQQHQGQRQQNNELLGRLRSLSNFASFLCVLDCTVLPLVTVALPLLGVLQLPDAQLALLNELGHKIALFFVLPVGSMTGIINFSSHQKKWILSLAALGIFLVAITNVHFHHLPTIVSTVLPSRITSTIENVLVAVQDCSGAAGTSNMPWHRITNVAGCASLLTSNYLSQKQGCAYHDHDDHGDTCDGHNHSHDHGHGDQGDCDHNHDQTHD